MKHSILRIIISTGAVVALLTLTPGAYAQWTYGSGNLNAAQTYDGLGVDSALNPRSQGATSHNDYVGVGGIGSMTVQSGDLTITANDFKFARNGNSTGTVSVVSGTLTINQLNQWGGGIGVNNNNNNGVLGTANISSGGTLNWFLSGSSEQSLRIGNGGSANGTSGLNTRGVVNLNGGTFNVTLDPAQALTDANRGFAIGQSGGTGTLNLNAGLLTVTGDLPFALGGVWGNLPTVALPGNVPAFTDNGNGLINLGSGVLQLIGSSLFGVGADDNINFLSSGVNVGALSILNWTSADFLALATAGKIQVDGEDVTDLSQFTYSSTGGQGILQLTSVPEPGAFALTIAGLGLLTVWNRRRA